MAALALTLAAGLSYVGSPSTADSIPMNDHMALIVQHLLETTSIELMISTISRLLSVRLSNLIRVYCV